jgi:hypothetical protein
LLNHPTTLLRSAAYRRIISDLKHQLAVTVSVFGYVPSLDWVGSVQVQGLLVKGVPVFNIHDYKAALKGPEGSRGGGSQRGAPIKAEQLPTPQHP